MSDCTKKYCKFHCAKHSDKPLKTWTVFSRGFHASWVLSPLHKEKLSIFLLCNLTIKVMMKTFWHPNLNSFPHKACPKKFRICKKERYPKFAGTFLFRFSFVYRSPIFFDVRTILIFAPHLSLWSIISFCCYSHKKNQSSFSDTICTFPFPHISHSS